MMPYLLDHSASIGWGFGTRVRNEAVLILPQFDIASYIDPRVGSRGVLSAVNALIFQCAVERFRPRITETDTCPVPRSVYT